MSKAESMESHFRKALLLERSSLSALCLPEKHSAISRESTRSQSFTSRKYSTQTALWPISEPASWNLFNSGFLHAKIESSLWQENVQCLIFLSLHQEHHDTMTLLCQKTSKVKLSCTFYFRLSPWKLPVQKVYQAHTKTEHIQLPEVLKNRKHS